MRIDKWRNPDCVGEPRGGSRLQGPRGTASWAINLQKPDGAGAPQHGFWPAKSAGITAYQAMSDAALARRPGRSSTSSSSRRSVDPLQHPPPPCFASTRLYSCGPRVSESAGYQFNEKDWMVLEDYDELISTQRLSGSDLPAAHRGRLRWVRGFSSFWTTSSAVVFGQSWVGAATRCRRPGR